MSLALNDQRVAEAIGLVEWAYGVKAKLQFLERMAGGERPGQAFMNVLRIFDQAEYVRLTGSIFDPFYVDEKLPTTLDKITSA